jgi:hypothetical protein
MSLLNYVLTGVAVIAILYSYSVGSTSGVVIWAVVLGLNIAFILVKRAKSQK